MASSVRHVNASLSNGTQITPTSDWTHGGWRKCNAPEYGDATNDHVMFALGAASGVDGVGLGVLAGANTTVQAFIFRASGGEFQAVTLLTGSNVNWFAYGMRHTAGSSSVDMSVRLEGVTTWTTTTLTLTAQLALTGGSTFNGTDPFAETARDSNSRGDFAQNTRMTDAQLLTATQNINTAPTGTNLHWSRLLDSTTATTDTGTAGNFTAGGTLQTAANEPTESAGGGDSNIETASRKLQRGLLPHLRMSPQSQHEAQQYLRARRAFSFAA